MVDARDPMDRISGNAQSDAVRPARIHRLPRVAYVYGQSLPNKAANSGAVADLCIALIDLSYAVTWGYIGRDTEEEMVRRAYRLPDSMKCTRLREMWGSLRYPALAVLSIIKIKADATITRMPQVAVLTALFGRPTILELHQHLHVHRHWNYWRLFLHLLPKKRLTVVATTEAIAEQIDPLLKLRAMQIAIIPSAASDMKSAESTAFYDVGYVGSFLPGKGIERVLSLARALPNVSFVVFGDPKADSAMAAELGELSNVTLAGFVDRSEIARALGAFRIGIAPYSEDGFGGRGSVFVSMDSLSSLKVLEYMSATRAVVSSRIPAIEKVIEDGETGLLCSPNEEHEWVEAVQRLIDDPELYKSLALNARRTFEQKHSYAKRASAFSALLSAFGQ